MTRWPHQETVTDQSQEVDLRFIIDPVMANCIVPRITTKMDVLRNLVSSVGLAVEQFSSEEEFLSTGRRGRPGCLVLDVRLSGRSGLDFQDDLALSGEIIEGKLIDTLMRTTIEYAGAERGLLILRGMMSIGLRRKSRPAMIR